jgi:PAT family beta-lactamase induction signal transducer AmpG
MPSEISMVCLCLSIESFGCGFGMAGFVRFLRYYGPGRSMAAYGDTCLALVALAMLLAGVVTGFIQDYFGYRRFFFFVIIMAIVAIASLWLLRNKRI